MSSLAFFGAIEIGLIYGLVGLGVLLTFRFLNFPDLSVEGSFPLGGAVAASWIVTGGSPWTALVLALLAGGLSGLVTALLSVRFGILHILAGILTMIALFSINIRIMGRPNVALLGEDTIITPLRDWQMDLYLARPILMLAFALLSIVLISRFLLSDIGLAMRVTGSNARMVRANGGNSDAYIYFGLALSNALVALAGGLFSQTSGFADVTSGVGTIVVGLAAVVLGETLFRSRSIWIKVAAAIVGSIVYRLFIAFALSFGLFGLQASDLNLVTAILVTVAMLAPRLRAKHYKWRKQ